MNPYEMDSGYPDSVNSSPRSKETDSDQRWEAGDSARFRLMCSYGGKIQQRSHDNQLSYVGGDTRILAVDRNIKFASMNSKLSSLWGTGVSFKYQLPNEDLDALVSVTNDEDMENMMAEYDRLQKMGYRFSRLRLFVFSNKPDGASSQSSLGSLMDETKRENWFVDALNVGPVSRSETAPQESWMNNMPNYSPGSEGIKGDRSSGQRANYDQTSSKEQEVYMGRDLQQQQQQQQQPEVQSGSTSPIIGYSPVDSVISAPTRIITPAAHQCSNQAEMGINLGRGFEQESNLRAKSKPVPEIGVLKTADRTAKRQEQEQYTSEFSIVSNPLAPQQPQLQVPIQEFQNLQLRNQPQDPIARQVDDNAIQGRRNIYSDPERALNLSNQEMTRPNTTLDQPYNMPQQQQYQQNPSPSEYYMHDQGSHFVPQSYWQIQEPTHGDQQTAYRPVYFVHSGSNMTTVPSMGQPAPGGGGSYYNPPVQRMTAPLQFYSQEAAPLSNPLTTGRAAARQTGSDPTEPYRAPIQVPAPVSKGPYTPVPSVPVASDAARVMYRPTVPVPLAHTDPYSYQNVMYEPSSRQVYYTQAPPAMNPQYHDQDM